MRQMPDLPARARLLPLSLAIACASTQVHAQPAPAPTLTYLHQPASLEWQPFRVWNGLIVTDVELDGHRTAALLDTGSPTAIADDTMADQARAAIAQTPGGPLRGQWARYGTLTFGGYRVAGGSAVHLSLRKLGTVPFAMIVGSDILRAIALQVDWSRHRLRYLLPGDSAVAGTVIPIGTATTTGGQTYLTTTLDICGASLNAFFDTGATSYAEIAAHALPVGHCAPLRQSDVLASSAGGPTIKRIVTFSDFALGPQHFGALPLAISDTGRDPLVDPAGFAASIGGTLFNRFNYTMDPSAGRMVLWGEGSTQPANYYGTTGIQLQFDPAKPALVVHVMAHSPAATAGIQYGDRICWINGARLHSDAPQQLYHDPPAGSSPDIALCDARRPTLVAADFLGENAAFAAITTPPSTPPQAPLTQAAIACSPQDNAGQPIPGKGDPAACTRLLAMRDVPPAIRAEAAQALAQRAIDRPSPAPIR